MKKLYANNAEKQRVYREKLREKQLQQQIEAAKTNTLQIQVKQSYDELVKRWLHGKTVKEAKEAYNHFLSTYMSINQDYLFYGITKYLDERTPLKNGITIGEMHQFLESFDNPIECPICHYFRSGLEDDCPECRLKLGDYKAWKAYRKSV